MTLEYCTRLLNVLCVTIRRILDQLKILLNIVQVDYMFSLVKESINTKENIRKFKNLLWLNGGITTLTNLISLFVNLQLEPEFIPNLVTPYIRYIHSVNPKFSDFIRVQLF